MPPRPNHTKNKNSITFPDQNSINEDDSHHNNQNHQNQNTPPPPEDQMQQLNELLRTAFQNPPPLPKNERPRPLNPFKIFKDVHPHEFKGTEDPTEAQIWIKEIKKAFCIAQNLENLKTSFATYMFKEEANFWWETIEAREQNLELPWNQFKELFSKNYFPPCLKNQMEVKFLELKQGEMKVSEYVANFNELSRFAPHQVDTDARKMRCFEQGLNKWIRGKVTIFELTNFSSLVKKTIIVEKK